MDKVMPLQEWLMKNKPEEKMLWNKAFWSQALFVRDILPRLFFKTFEEAEKNPWLVISEHTSKSIELPVYYLKLDDVAIIMRENFYNWKVSVISANDLSIDSAGLFDSSEKIHSVYCEGFDPKWVFDCYDNNKKEFTVELNSDYNLYTFLFLLNRAR